jgi:ABC-type transport system substrate-binding protein
MTAAGYPNGVTVTLQYINGYDFGTNSLVALEQSELAAVGINVTLVPEDAATWVANSETSYTNFTLGWNEVPYQADPAIYVQVFGFEYGTGKGEIPAALTTLTSKALAAPSTTAFEKDINAIETYEDNNVYPRLELLTVNNFVAYKKGMTGVSVPESGSPVFLANVKGA